MKDGEEDEEWAIAMAISMGNYSLFMTCFALNTSPFEACCVAFSTNKQDGRISLHRHRQTCWVNCLHAKHRCIAL